MRIPLSLLAISGLLLCCGCEYFLPTPPCPPPPSARMPVTELYSGSSPTVVPVIPEPEEILGLADLLDIALQNSPTTRAAWYRAKQAAADLGAARGAYLPPVAFNWLWQKQQTPQVDLGDVVFLTRQKIVGASLSTTYLIYDFGGRNGNLFAALAALDSLNWSYNWEVQTVLINVIQSYYNYINAVAIVEADKATVEDNQKTAEAATALRQTGVKGLADELQARTSLIQSQIILEQDQANLNIALATLIRSLGLPPDSPLSVSLLPEKLPTEKVCENMAVLMQIAKENRSDLMAMRSTILSNRFLIRSAEAALFPNLTTDLSYGKLSVNDLRYLDAYNIQFNLNYNVFNQFADINAVRKAQAGLLESQANLDNEELVVFLSVLSDYYEFLASSRVLQFSFDYIEIATKNREVAFANYKAGINTIIEVMTANNALNIARKQLTDAKTNFLTSIANLSYHTGGLSASETVTLLREGTDEENPCLPSAPYPVNGL